MSTKTGLISEINEQITAIITQAKHRLSMLSVVNEIYPTIYNEVYNVIGNDLEVTDFIDEEIFYDLYISKVGNRVTVNGNVKNTSDFIFTGNFAEIVLDEFKEKISTKQFFTSNGKYFQVFNNKIFIQNLGADETAYFNFNYFTND